MFLGTFDTKANDKWQVSLPAKIKNALGGDRAIISAGFEKCIYGFTISDWEITSAQELQKPLSTPEGREIRKQMFAKALEIDLDKQGRFVIPDYLRKHAGLTGELIVIGAGDHFEIWDKEEYDRLSHSGIAE
ncbi:MAG: division/cell wall cluster transcriptional repressor MraZ [Patescibacteria group bacterium]